MTRCSRLTKPSLIVFVFTIALIAYREFDYIKPYRYRGFFTAFVPLGKRTENKWESPNFRKLNANSKSNLNRVCDWSKDEPLYLPDEDDDLEQMMITWMNSMNLTYSLLNGALIGAYRHQGKIPDDYDIDFLLPVWLNFGCQNRSQDPICREKNGQRAVNLVMDAFSRLISGSHAPFSLTRMTWGGFRLVRNYVRLTDRRLHADVLVLINGSSWMHWFEDDVCRCWYRSIYAQCINDALQLVSNIFKQTKKEILTPKIFRKQASGARASVVERSRRNPFHPRWKKASLSNQR